MVTLFQIEGDHLQALEWLDKQEGQTGASFGLWMDRGRSQNELGQHLNARASYRQALEIRPADADAQFFLNEIEELLEETEENPAETPSQ